jgi:large subunit ribosomal protein L21
MRHPHLPRNPAPIRKWRRRSGEAKLEAKMKYAVIESGGKQYLAREGEAIDIDRLPAEPGSAVNFTQVLLVTQDGETQIGSPYVKGAAVSARVAEHVKGRKIVVFKYIPKERYRRKLGHRQRYTRVTIERIELPGALAGVAAAAEAGEEKARPAARQRRAGGGSTPAGGTPKAAAKSATKKATRPVEQKKQSKPAAKTGAKASSKKSDKAAPGKSKVSKK